MAIYTRFGTPARFIEARKTDESLDVRAHDLLTGRPIAYGKWVSISEFRADGGLNEIVEAFVGLVPK